MIRKKLAYRMMRTRSNTLSHSNRQIKIWDKNNGINKARFRKVIGRVEQGSKPPMFSKGTISKSED